MQKIKTLEENPVQKFNSAVIENVKRTKIKRNLDSDDEYVEG